MGGAKGYRRSTGLWAGRRLVGGADRSRGTEPDWAPLPIGTGGARPGREGSPGFRAKVKPTRNICRQDGWL